VTVTTVMRTGKERVTQMSLLDEWGKARLTVNGVDVFNSRTGKVMVEWLSGCESARALTQDLMGEVCELSNLVAALRQVVKNKGCPGVDGMTVHELERRGHRFVRYADDLIILVKSELSANRVMTSISEFIENRLRLKVNREKSRICKPIELNFLGHTILSDGALGLSRKSEDRFKEKIRSITCRNRGVSLERIISELKTVLLGWCNYFRYARMVGKLEALDGWIRRKLRCFRLKQCKRASGIIKFLTSLGVPKWRAILIGTSHKGWFRLAGSPPVSEGMNIEWFRMKGLVNLTDYYRLNFMETAQYESTLGGVRGR